MSVRWVFIGFLSSWSEVTSFLHAGTLLLCIQVCVSSRHMAARDWRCPPLTRTSGPETSGIKNAASTTLESSAFLSVFSLGVGFGWTKTTLDCSLRSQWGNSTAPLAPFALGKWHWGDVCCVGDWKTSVFFQRRFSKKRKKKFSKIRLDFGSFPNSTFQVVFVVSWWCGLYIS